MKSSIPDSQIVKGDTMTETPKRARGRPQVRSDEAFRALILEAAMAEFLELGYKATCMENIARRAKVSKGTIYRFWTTKSDLFAAMQIDRRDKFIRTIDENDLAAMPMLEGLASLLTKFAQIALSPENILINRLIISEAAQFSEIAESYFQEGWCRAAAILTRLLKHYEQQGSIRLQDAKVGAAMLLSMVTGEIQRAAILGIATAMPDEQALHARVSFALSLFLHGSGAK